MVTLSIFTNHRRLFLSRLPIIENPRYNVELFAHKQRDFKNYPPIAYVYGDHVPNNEISRSPIEYLDTVRDSNGDQFWAWNIESNDIFDHCVVCEHMCHDFADCFFC